MLHVMYKKMHDMYDIYIQSRHICTEKRFSSVYYQQGYIIVQMTSHTCVQKFNLYIPSIYTCITSQSERCRMKECPMMHKQLSLPQRKKKSHHMKSSFAAQVSL